MNEENAMTPAFGAKFTDLAADPAAQVMVKGYLPTNGTEIKSTDLARSIKEKEPGWEDADLRGFGRMFADMWKKHRIMKRSGVEKGSYAYSRRPEDVIIPPELEPPLMERRPSAPRFGDPPIGDPEAESTVSEEVEPAPPSEETSVTVDYNNTFTALWAAYPTGEFIPAHLIHDRFGFTNSDDLNKFVEQMVTRGHVIRASIKGRPPATHSYSGVKLTPEGKRHLVEFQNPPPTSPVQTPPTVAAAEPAEPPRVEVAPATPPIEHIALITELQRELAEVKQSVIAAHAVRITDVLRGQSTSIAQACLIEAGRQLGLDLVPRPFV